MSNLYVHIYSLFFVLLRQKTAWFSKRGDEGQVEPAEAWCVGWVASTNSARYYGLKLIACLIIASSASLHAIQIGIPDIPININVPFSSIFSSNEESKKAQVDEKVYKKFKLLVNTCDGKKFIDLYLKDGASVSPEVQAKLLREAVITKECLEYKKERFSVEHETEKVLNAEKNVVISAIPLVAAPFIIHFIRLYSKCLEETGESLMCNDIETEQKLLCAAASAVVLLGTAGLVGLVRTICYIEKHTQKRELGPDYYKPKEESIQKIETLLRRTIQK